MTTHELKLDIKYFDDVESGKKNFEIRNNDRDFKVGDILKMKAWNGQDYVIYVEEQGSDPYPPFRGWVPYNGNADTVMVRVTAVLKPAQINARERVGNFWYGGSKHNRYIRHNDVVKVLHDYFHTDTLPDGYVVLGIEVQE